MISSASALRALHVDALSMRADRAQVQVGEVFHLAIHAHVREAVTALDELVVPDVGTMQLLGDERHVSTSPGGTDVVETLTLEPTQSGAFTFKGAYLDAIDARTEKPSRFSANPVRVVVAKPGGQFSESVPSLAFKVLVVVAALIAIPALIVLAIVVAASRGPARARKPIVTPPSPPPAAPAPPPTRRDVVAEALRDFRTARTEDSLLRLRAALFNVVGADEGATLRDALAGTSDPALRDALAAAEHAAFGPDAEREASSDELIRTTEMWLR
ncbi:MAG TPA: hypothetical protein VHS78_12520 [Candidatus Elarobacter sp.]|jgi:hypothetical protein|nr:hypothetical protein [Candidatus Elarobacter sp.]